MALQNADLSAIMPNPEPSSPVTIKGIDEVIWKLRSIAHIEDLKPVAVKPCQAAKSPHP